jgi:hypothetical protein
MSDDFLLSTAESDELLSSVTAGDSDDSPASPVEVVDFFRREILTDSQMDECSVMFRAAVPSLAAFFSAEEADVELSFVDTMDFMTYMKSVPRVCRCASLGSPSGFSLFADIDMPANTAGAEQAVTEKFMRSFLTAVNKGIFSEEITSAVSIYDIASLIPVPADPSVVMAAYEIGRGKDTIRCTVLVPAYRFTSAYSLSRLSPSALTEQGWRAALNRKAGGFSPENRYVLAIGHMKLSAANALRLKHNTLMKFQSVDISPAYLVDLAAGDSLLEGEVVMHEGMFALRVTHSGKRKRYIDQSEDGPVFCLAVGAVSIDEETAGMIGNGCIIDTDTEETGLFSLYCSNGAKIPCRFTCTSESGWVKIFMK